MPVAGTPADYILGQEVGPDSSAELVFPDSLADLIGFAADLNYSMHSALSGSVVDFPGPVVVAAAAVLVNPLGLLAAASEGYLEFVVAAEDTLASAVVVAEDILASVDVVVVVAIPANHQDDSVVVFVLERPACSAECLPHFDVGNILDAVLVLEPAPRDTADIHRIGLVAAYDDSVTNAH